MWARRDSGDAKLGGGGGLVAHGKTMVVMGKGGATKHDL